MDADPYRIRIQGFNDKNVSVKYVQTKREAFSHQKRTPSTSKHKFISFLWFFCPSGSGSKKFTKINADLQHCRQDHDFCTRCNRLLPATPFSLQEAKLLPALKGRERIRERKGWGYYCCVIWGGGGGVGAVVSANGYI